MGMPKEKVEKFSASWVGKNPRFLAFREKSLEMLQSKGMIWTQPSHEWLEQDKVYFTERKVMTFLSLSWTKIL